ncbi:MAG: EAL domain-containing protein [Caulobacteraceae bacterium]|nr:EAL domain-containing protein [Caulobacteraceae bacterium]
MRKVITALLAGAYLCLALAAALLIWRGGGGWGAGMSALIGGLGLALGLHSYFARAVETSALRNEIADVREAHVILADQLEKMHNRLGDLAETVAAEAIERSEALTHEVRLLEDLVHEISDTLEERLAQTAIPAPRVPSAPARSSQHMALLETIRDALNDNRVDLYLQPVVGLPQRRTVFYESFSRLRDASGRVLMPSEYLSAAEPEGLMSAVDNLMLFRCMQIVRRLSKSDRKVGIFCNISLTSLGDETFFPQFLEFLGQNRDLAGGLIFELGQSAFERRGSIEARNMGRMAEMGFRFSLDKVTDFDLDFQDLARADVKYVKVAAQTLISQMLDNDGRLTLRSVKDIAAADYADLARRYGVELIAEKIESERQVVDILELNIAYGQGNLFGEPRAIRDAVLAEADPPSDFVRSTLRRRVMR